jgi:hypothetical protein
MPALELYFSAFLQTGQRMQRIFYGLPGYLGGHEQLFTPRAKNHSGVGGFGGRRAR